MNLKVKLYLLFIIIALTNHAYAQQKVADRLKKNLQNNATNDTNRVNILNDLAYALYNNNNWSEVKKYSDEAISLSQRLKFSKGEAYAYRRLSTVYMKDNANPLSLEYLIKAYKIFKLLGDSINCARTLTNVGIYYHTIKYYNFSLNYFSQALQQANALKRYTLQIILLSDIGDVYERTGQIAKAHSNYVEALVIAQEKKIDDDLPFCYSNLASIYFKEKTYKTALKYCEKVIAIQKASSEVEPKDMAETYITQARVYFALKNYVFARQILNESNRITQSTENSEDRLLIYREFYLLDSAQHNYEAALKSNYLYNKLDDSLININKNQVVALFNVKFELQRRDDENKRLRAAAEKNQVIISKQHAVQAGLLIGLVVICLGFVYFQHINNQVKAKNKIIEQQNLVLENSNMVKNKLFSIISHDLRSPITQLISMLNLWESGQVNKQELWELTPEIKGDIINTLELLDNLLIWSRNQLQGFKFNPEWFNAHDLADENIKDLHNNIVQKKLVVENSISPPTRLYADIAMVKIVLRNLMSNAIKFTPQGGLISIGSYRKNNKLIIYVQDTGVGIKNTDKEKIFSFTTHSTIGTDNEKGTGIGLRICRDFMEMNQGEIWVESKENEGTKFFISFPDNVKHDQV
jgi:signal transduction histidine kinase